MKEGQEKEFESFLNAVFNKKSFSKLIGNSYRVNDSELGNKFLEKLRSYKN
jgi:hypothetical protein